MVGPMRTPHYYSGHSGSTHSRCSAASFSLHVPGSPNEHHSIMYHSEHFDDTICAHAVDNQMSWPRDAVLPFEECSRKSEREDPNAGNTMNGPAPKAFR
jgi:hypothetical protein